MTSFCQGNQSAQETIPPNNILFFQNLPHEATSMMLQVLFQQYPGFREVRMIEAKPGTVYLGLAQWKRTPRRGRKGKACSVLPPAVGLLPWLVFINGSSEENQTFYDISESHCHVKSIPELQGKLVATCSYGWLVVGGYLISDDCFLLNPISTKKIQLPSLTPDFSYDNCVLSSPPDNPECVVMFLDFDFGTLDVTFCKPGDVEWTRQDFKLHDEDDSDYVRSVGVHKGDICILTWYEHLYFVKFDKSYSITLVDLKVDDSTCPHMRKLHSRFPTYLVETCGELLRLHCYILHRQVVDIWVYKLDFDEKVWTRIKELKDQAIFIGSSGGQVLACSTKESRIHGNKIYLTLAEERSLYVYDLDLCALEVCLPCLNVKADWVQNDWILPVFED